MGPVSRAAIVKHQRAVEETLGAVLEELQGMRAALNTLNGRNAMELETVNERIDRQDERISSIERARSD